MRDRSEQPCPRGICIIRVAEGILAEGHPGIARELPIIHGGNSSMAVDVT